MTDTCETDKAHGHSSTHTVNDPQCISYSRFVAVLAAGNETELERLCQLLHDPGPYFERCLYELIMTKLLDDDTRQVLESAHYNNFQILRELLSKPGLIISLRRDGKELTRDQYFDLLALDSFINWLRNCAEDITTVDRDFFEYTFLCWIYQINQHIAYSEVEELKSHKYNLERHVHDLEMQVLELELQFKEQQRLLGLQQRGKCMKGSTVLSINKHTSSKHTL